MQDKIFNKLKAELPEIQKGILFKNYTTFKIGGPAKYFCVANNQKDIITSIKKAKELKLLFFILGGGSNLLVSDKGYKGLVIKIKNQKSKIKNKTIFADAGVSLEKIVKLASVKSLSGLEWAVGIPGTIGAAVYGNIGAFGLTMEESIKSVKILDVKILEVKNFSIKECEFDNKESIFKKNRKLIILSVILKLKNGNKEEIQKEMKRFSDYRKKNHPLNLPSAGCVFKNYNRKITNKNLLKKYPELIEFNKGSRIPTSYLIDKCGLKGKKIGGAKISEKHANFIVNLGKAKSKDVVKLVKLAKEKVKNKFGIELEEEIQYLGF